MNLEEQVFQLGQVGMLKRGVFKLFFLCLGILFSGHVFCAEFLDLTDDCKGQILLPTVGYEPLCFQGCSSNGQWKCSSLNESTVIVVSPGEIADILPLYMDSDTFDVISYVLCQVMSSTGGSEEENRQREACLKVCNSLLYSFPSSRTTMLQQCLSDIALEVEEIQRNLQAGWNAGDWIIDRYMMGKPFVSIKSAMASQDFQIAIPCYFRLREMVLNKACRRLQRKYKDDLKVLFDKFGRELLEAYRLQADECNMRIEKFLSVCPGVFGHWKNGAPVNLDAMHEMAENSLKSFEKTLEYSPSLDFRHWGNAMLGVLRLFPNASLVKKQATAFDKALQNYADKHK